MELEVVLKILVLVIGFYMAWSIGANDVSNAMGTSVGSGALTLKRAVMIAAIFEFSGALFVGSNVSETMQRGLIDTDMFMKEPIVLILGMCAALFGTSLWLQIASYFGWPVSTTHAMVGAILGFGGVIGGIDAIQWAETGSIALSWIISPVTAGIISYLIFSMLQRNILYAMSPVEATKKFMPLLIFIVFATFTVSLLSNGLENLQISFSESLGLALAIGLVASGIGYLLVKKVPLPNIDDKTPSRHLPQTVVSLEKAIKHLQRVHVVSFDEVHTKVGSLLDEVKALSQQMRKETSFAERTSKYHLVERMFVYLQVITACFVAFAHGSNDVANAIGPVAAVLDVIKNGIVSDVTQVPSWLLAFGGLGIVVGLASWGWRVIQTVGKKITQLTPTRGFCAEFGAATTILIASKFRPADFDDSLPCRRCDRRWISTRHARPQSQHPARYRPLLDHHPAS